MRILQLALFMTLASLTGCFGATQKPAEPVTTIKEVPVPVPCVDHVPDAPQLTHDALGRTAALDLLYAAALTDKDKLQIYANTLRVQVVACSTIPKR